MMERRPAILKSGKSNEVFADMDFPSTVPVFRELQALLDDEGSWRHTNRDSVLAAYRLLERLGIFLIDLRLRDDLGSMCKKFYDKSSISLHINSTKIAKNPCCYAVFRSFSSPT